MIQKKHFHILNAFSILMFAILANYIFDLKIDFRQSIYWMAIVKLISLFVSTFSLYYAMNKLRDFYEEAENDDRNETDLAIKAKNPIMKRYELKYNKEKLKIYILFALSILSVSLFFLIEPVTSILRESIIQG